MPLVCEFANKTLTVSFTTCVPPDAAQESDPDRPRQQRLVSALVFGGLPRAVLELAEAGQCEFFYSPAIQIEVRRVLAEKFDWSQAMLRAILPTVWSIGTPVTPHIRLNVVRSDPDDNRILECAMAVHADFVISGDHHLLDLQNYKSISIITACQFIERIVPE